MSNLEVKQIEEENKQLLKARRLLLDSRDGEKLLASEKLYVPTYQSLSDHDVKRIGEVDFPLFTIDVELAEVRDSVATDLRLSEMRQEDRIIYEANLLILLNRWQKSLKKNPDEIRFNTKLPLFSALSKLTLLQVQTIARRSTLISKICISKSSFEKLTYEQLSRDSKNCIIVNG